LSKYEGPSLRSTGHGPNESLGLVIYIIWTSAILALLAFLYFMFFGKSETIDSVTNCGSNPEKHLAVLVDVSDPLATAQRASLVNRFAEISNISKGQSGLSLSKGDKLTVYFVTESDKPELVFQACSPGSADEADRFSEARNRVQAAWRRFSRDMIDQVDRKVTSADTLSASYIVESLAYVRAKEFPPSDQILNSYQKFNLVIISDFLQSSSLLSHYRSEWPTARELHKRFPVVLDGIEVDALYVSNPAYLKEQSPELLAWWREYFSTGVTGGTLKSWRAL